MVHWVGFFPAKGDTTTRVSYTTDYDAAGCQHLVACLHGTGSSWIGPIDEIVVVIDNRPDRWVAFGTAKLTSVRYRASGDL